MIGLPFADWQGKNRFQFDASSLKMFKVSLSGAMLEIVLHESTVISTRKGWLDKNFLFIVRS